jgi:hypothetical protein
VQVTPGSAQDADTLVNVPAPPADVYPAQFSLVAPALAALSSAPGADEEEAEDEDDPAGPGIIS